MNQGPCADDRGAGMQKALPGHDRVTPHEHRTRYAEPMVLSQNAQLSVAFSGSRALITGGLGFIGSHVARRLVEYGAQVTVIDNLVPEYGGNWFNVADIKDRITVQIGDIRDQALIDKLVPGADFIFNLAGQTSHLDSMTDPHTDLAINADAQLSILEACRVQNPATRVVFASTRQLYGKPDFLPVTEEHPTRPVDVNGINKLAGEWYHLLYHDVYAIPACALRLTNTYGPGMRVKDARQTFLGIWIKQALSGETIKVFGDGQQLRDFNYVDDCVNALLIAATSPNAEGKVFNLGSREVISLEKLAQLICEIEPQARYELVPFPEDRKKIDIGDYYADTTLINKELGWEPSVSLVEGITETLNFYRENSSEYWDR
jgi:UDP-glucose 4-epimerase